MERALVSLSQDHNEQNKLKFPALWPVFLLVAKTLPVSSIPTGQNLLFYLSPVGDTYKGLRQNASSHNCE